MILTKDQVSNSKDRILEFKSLNDICKFTSLKTFDPKTDKDVEFTTFGRSWSLGIGNFTPTPMLFSDRPLKMIMHEELDYCITKILENRDIGSSEVVGSGESIYDKIEFVINELKYDGLNPSTIFIPHDNLDEFCKLGNNKKSKLYNKFTKTTLKLDDSTTLDIIQYQSIIKLEDIIILDKNKCICTFKPSTDEKTSTDEKLLTGKKRLQIEIIKSEKDWSKVDLIAKTEINLKIKDPSAIKILKIKKKDV